jgi:hypothetical protein
LSEKTGLLTIITSDADKSDLERLDAVRYVSLGYTCSEIFPGDTVFMNGLIWVDLRTQDDIPILEGIAEEYNWKIFLEKYKVTLLCHKTSKNTALQLSNMLIELGFQDAQPLITSKCGAGGE